MFNKDYLLPGLATIALALIFPVYWIYVFTVAGFDFPKGYYANILTMDLSDLVYVILGLLEVYVYLSLKRILHDQLNYRGLDALLIIMICNTALFYFGLFLLDIGMFFAGEQLVADTKASILTASYYLSMSCMFIFGLLGLLVGIILLRKSNDIGLPSTLKLFAAIMLIAGILQLTFIFGFVVILLFPLALLILAFYFLQKPQMIEVV